MKKNDRRILLELVKDGRQSSSSIAKKLKITRQTVAKKIDEFYKNGTIKNFTVKMSGEKFGLLLKAYILIKSDQLGDFKGKCTQEIRNWKEVSQIHLLFGTFDALIEILVRDRNELTQIVERLYALGCVKNTETFVAYEAIKDEGHDPFEKILRIGLAP